jgi:hypothetical protein
MTKLEQKTLPNCKLWMLKEVGMKSFRNKKPLMVLLNVINGDLNYI